MPELNEAPASMLTFSGTPIQVGSQIWVRMCAPAVQACRQTRPGDELLQLYTGLLLSALGNMTADFGHPQTLQLVREIVERFGMMGGELQGSQVQ